MVLPRSTPPGAKPFISARSVLTKAGGALAAETQLCTFHTVSKGALGECGLRCASPLVLVRAFCHVS